MQKEGDGMAFVHSGGTLAKKRTKSRRSLKVDTGCIVGFTKDVDYDIEFIGGIKNSFWRRRFILRYPGPEPCMHNTIQQTRR
jgi:uncharacterized protein (AIM24 family)